MDEREKIFGRLVKRKPESVPLVYLPDDQPVTDELIDRFTENLRVSGGSVIRAGKETLTEILKKHIPGSGDSVNLSKHYVSEDLMHDHSLDPGQIDHVDLLILDGSIGVAENGAVWIPEVQSGERRLPFIARKIMIILNKQNLVFDLSQAYRKIDLSRIEFGLWIAGPSKTADIEQSLVIGAQGALQHTVIIAD